MTYVLDAGQEIRGRRREERSKPEYTESPMHVSTNICALKQSLWLSSSVWKEEGGSGVAQEILSAEYGGLPWGIERYCINERNLYYGEDPGGREKKRPACRSVS